MKYIETETIGLKRTFNDSIEKEIVAFLNTKGRTIYLGVEDNGDVSGIQVNELDGMMKKISDIITDKILPNPQDLVSTSATMIDSKFVIEIDFFYFGVYIRKKSVYW